MSGGRRCVCLIVLASGLASSGGTAQDISSPSPLRQAELIRLVRQDCGSCHGLTLKGGLGPPLTATALAEKSAASLVATIVQGRPGTPMPPFRSILDANEAVWIVDHLLAGFPRQ